MFRILADILSLAGSSIRDASVDLGCTCSWSSNLDWIAIGMILAFIIKR